MEVKALAADKPAPRRTTRHAKPARRAPASSRRGVAVLAAICALALAAGFLLDAYMPGLDSAASGEAASPSPVRISEVMTSNASAYKNDLGAYDDWVEFVNTGTEDVRLNGYTLRRADDLMALFTFPDVTLAPGEYILVYCDGVDRNTAGYALHAAFRLSADGVTLQLRDASGALADSVDVPALSRNHVYQRGEDGAWENSDYYTPGLANTLENHLGFDAETVESPLVVSEIMSANRTYLPDADGACHDYIELHNTSAQTIDLSGYFLTDDEDALDKWAFPEGTVIAGGGYLLVYASGQAQSTAGEIHASFKLSSDGEPVILSDAQGRVATEATPPALLSDQAWSLGEDGEYTAGLAPTPGFPNTAEGERTLRALLEQESASPVYISEIVASAGDTALYDWVEIYNPSAQAVDISGWGLSDDGGSPRKWRFPEGTVLQPGQYMAVYLSGMEGQSTTGTLSASFRLSSDGGYSFMLSDASGNLLDRVFVPEQYTGISYARMANGGFLYVAEPTPNAANASTGYEGRADKPAYSVTGGLYDEGETLTVELSAAPGARIYYTLDCTDPDETSTLYTGPIAVSANTIVRARAYSDGLLPSYMASQTYFFGVEHTMRVVSLVADPENIFGEDGIHTRYLDDIEREGHVEIYTTDGSQLLSDNCGLKLHGADSRKLDQKNFKVIARGEYGTNRFHARLFSERDYEEYQSFILRCSSEDGPMTRMRDSILTSLAEGTGVFYQKTELCVVYINGQYWGQYNMRERICAASICQYEGWEGQEDDIDLVKGNTTVMRGSDDSYQAMLAYVKEYGIPDDETLARVGEVIDLDNYIAYHALQIFVGNADTLNVKRYRNANADGKWRWAIYDLDWGFYVDTNSIRRWLDPEGMGAGKRTDNSLFIALMNNPTFYDRFLTFMGDMLATEWVTSKIVDKIETRYYELLPEMPMQFERWGQSQSNFDARVSELVEYARTRPRKLVGYFQETLSLTNEQMEHYFGDAMRRIEEEEAAWA